MTDEPDYRQTQAFQPWLPTYEQVLHDWYDPTTQTYKYGFPALVIDAEKYPEITRRKDEITTRFFERYATRMVNQETMKRWQLRLQNRFDEIAPEFERAFRLYDEYKEQIEDDVIEGYKQESESNAQAGGQDKTVNKVNNKLIDTPDTKINANPDYADTLNKTEGDNTITYGGTNKVTANVKYTRTGAVILQSINTTIMDWKDIDTEFIKMFENNFLNIFWS